MNPDPAAPPNGPQASTAAPKASPWMLALESTTAALLVALFILLLASALLRNRGFTAPAVYEVIRLAFVYLVGLSALVAFARRANLRVPGWWKEDAASYQAALLGLSAGLAFLALQMLLRQGFRPDAASLLGYPEGTLHIPIALFACGLTAVSAVRLRQTIKAESA